MQAGRWARRRAGVRALGARLSVRGARQASAWGARQEGARGAEGRVGRGIRAGPRKTSGASGGARHERTARALGALLGVLLGCRLCTWCTQPVFDSV